MIEFPPDGHFHSAAGHQPKRRKIHGGRPGDPLWHGGGQRHRKAGHGGDRGGAECKRTVPLVKGFCGAPERKRSQQADRRELYQGGRIRLLRRDEKAAHVRLRQCAR